MDEYEVHLPFGLLFVVATLARAMENVINAAPPDDPFMRVVYDDFMLSRGWMAA